jgi:hypothetical protein
MNTIDKGVEEADGWTQMNDVLNPAAITIKCNDLDAVWHLAIYDTGGEPSAELVGEVYRGPVSWEGYNIVGNVYVRVEKVGLVPFAVTE